LNFPKTLKNREKFGGVGVGETSTTGMIPPAARVIPSTKPQAQNGEIQ